MRNVLFCVQINKKVEVIKWKINGYGCHILTPHSGYIIIDLTFHQRPPSPQI